MSKSGYKLFLAHSTSRVRFELLNIYSPRKITTRIISSEVLRQWNLLSDHSKALWYHS